MTNDFTCIAIVMAVALTFTITIGILTQNSMEIQAIKHNCAKYNSQTSNFEWIENNVKK